MPFRLDIPTSASAPTTIELNLGSSLIFVGANGGGKTRLAAHIEQALGLSAHRISAHRALTLNPDVPKISEDLALNGLRTGAASPDAQLNYRVGNRWQSKAATSLLNDFDFVVQALFAEQGNASLITHKRNRAGDHSPAEPTKFERLTSIWERLLPHRTLQITGDSISVVAARSPTPYKGSDLSDGERAIFYLIGQTLLAAENSVLIIDEPELHIHRSIMARLWDELEAARKDCAFVFITHDLEFAAARTAAKFVIRDYVPTQWTVDEVPADTGFDEATATLILGSRRPILFVEGEAASLDAALYRACFPDWTVLPRGSCEQVIHSVRTMRANEALTRVTCSGIVDADDYQPDDVQRLGTLGIAVLPVAEIENLFLLPVVSRAIAEIEGLSGAELDACLTGLKAAAFASIEAPGAIEQVVTRYCRRRIDRTPKKIDLSAATTVASIATEYATRTAALDVGALALAATNRITAAKNSGDLPALLANYDNKALLNLAATHLKKAKLRDFREWLTRVLRGDKQPTLSRAVRAVLPTIVPR